MSAAVSTGPVGAAPRLGGFASTVRSEWTKLRTVRGWVLGLGAAAVVLVLFGLVSAAGSERSCVGPGGAECRAAVPPTGPDGTPVADRFSFAHRTLDGDGTVTVRVSDLRGGAEGPEPWAKAGLMLKDGTGQGSTYAAVMVTGAHGVRFQHDYVHDTAGSPGAVSPAEPRWLRLTREGRTVTGFESPDGSAWSEVGTVELADLPAAAEVGAFVASPDHVETDLSPGAVDVDGGTTEAAADLSDLELDGASGVGAWTFAVVGATPDAPGALTGDAGSGAFTLTGSGDVAPLVTEPTDRVEQSLVGAFAGIVVVIVVATMFMTSEHRRGVVLTSFAATPARRRVLAAKAVVVGVATFAVGLAATLIALPIVGGARTDRGATIAPVASLTEARIVVGTAALLAVAAVLAVGVAALLRRSTGTVIAVVGATVLPYLLAVGSVLPSGLAEWLLRVTPAAGFAVQQSVAEFAQVDELYVPATGFFPLSPLAGLAVACAWAAVSLGVAAWHIERRDA
ncbi:MAG: hypothetical protein S0880_23080 [Actinomycetota bacterium]|nr:hypothetical protein [Actinomycetota bacterium]